MTSILPINPDMNIGGELTLSLDDFLVSPGISDFLARSAPPSAPA